MKHCVTYQDRAFRSEVERGDFPLSEFDHRAHIRLVYVYLSAADPDTAHRQMRNTLQGYLQANKVDESKYHETITRAWIKAVRHFMQQTKASDSAACFIQQQPQLLNTNIMLTHYSVELLFSDGARAAFVKPDLQAIPEYTDTPKK